MCLCVCECLVKVMSCTHTHICVVLGFCSCVRICRPTFISPERGKPGCAFPFWPTQSLLTIVIAFLFSSLHFSISISLSLSPLDIFLFPSPAFHFHFLCLAHLLKNSLVKAFAKENSQLSGCRAKQCETGQTRGYELLILSYMYGSGIFA